MKKNIWLLLIVCSWYGALGAHSYDFNDAMRSMRFPEHPRVTIITSVYESDWFIQGFLQDIVQQTIFHECELIIINACSPGNEEPIILAYKEIYPNITYLRLDQDPGLYGVWNIGLEMARSVYVTNANTDDRLAFNCYELHAHALDQAPHIDLVYSDYYCTTVANETMLNHSSQLQSQLPEYDPGYMYLCLPNNHPMWRLSMHKTAGYFNPAYKSVGDWEMWCRAITYNSVFKKVPGVLGLYYRNANGLSFDPEKKDLIAKEIFITKKMYKHLFFNDQTYQRYKTIS